MRKAFPYQVVTAWSDEDQAYVARVPALKHCIATGSSVEKAAKEARIAAEAVLEVMARRGQTHPAPDATLERLQALAPLVKLTTLAKKAKIPSTTLSSKLKRSTPLTKEEEQRISQVLSLHGVTA
jgi:predicted RNase H-like HicB family nuclease